MKKIIFNGEKLTKRQLEELAAEVSRTAQNFDRIWVRQQKRK